MEGADISVAISDTSGFPIRRLTCPADDERRVCIEIEDAMRTAAVTGEPIQIILTCVDRRVERRLMTYLRGVQEELEFWPDLSDRQSTGAGRP